MQATPLLTTPRPTDKAKNFLMFAGLAAAVSYYILMGSVQPGMVRVFGWMFVACSLACLYGIFTLSALTIYEDRLEMEFLFIIPKKTILRKDITKWEEREMKGYRYRANNKMIARFSYLLTLHTTSGKVRIPSLNYANYDQIKAELTAGKIQAT